MTRRSKFDAGMGGLTSCRCTQTKLCCRPLDHRFEENPVGIVGGEQTRWDCLVEPPSGCGFRLGKAGKLISD
jgi:hypothetical protein